MSITGGRVTEIRFVGGIPRRVCCAAVLLALAAFGLYGVTMGDLVGYEPETAAVAEGFVTAGQLRVLANTPLAPAGSGQGLIGRGGRRFGRQGLTQPVLEAPLYFLGWKLDELVSHGRRYSARLALLRLYNPAMAALTVLAMFVLLLFRGVSERRALALAAVSAVATLIWPYSKIGMDTTLMAMLAVTYAAAAWAAARPTPSRLALVGAAAALAANSKPYGALLLLGMLPLLARPALALAQRRRMAVLSAFAAPVIVGAAAIAWYNWYRTGSVSDFLNTYIATPVAAPINALGLFVSPGKGLLLFSPLVILGIVGMRALWHADRPLAWAIVLTVAINTAVVAASLSWADETWGPRYLVPSAWLLVLPLAWWTRGRSRVRWVAIVAIIGGLIQIAGVLARYDVSIPGSRAVAGAPVYPRDGLPHVSDPYGDDGPRWVPAVSPLLFQLELTVAYVKEQLTGAGFIISYHPYDGIWTSVNLTHPDRSFAPLPDFWWAHSNEVKLRFLAVFLGLIAVGSGTALLATRARRASVK
ncbi:MAG: hypothetical protein ACR2QA_16875 [Solirubrobacteraceae bacterium]